MFHVPGVFISRLESIFAKKNRVCFGSTGARFGRQSPTLPLYYERKVTKTIFPQSTGPEEDYRCSLKYWPINFALLL